MGLIKLVTLDVYSTHPICASLDHPLFACGGKRGFEKVEKLLRPLSSEAEERADKRSVVGVSRFSDCHEISAAILW